MDRAYCVYLLASQRNGTLYIGVTNDLARRVYQHKMKQLPGFTSRYNVHMLVWYETWRHQRSDRAGEAVEEVGAAMEARTYRKR
jgi:predicted GIY-YIG superfamily endonuclease